MFNLPLEVIKHNCIYIPSILNIIFKRERVNCVYFKILKDSVCQLKLLMEYKVKITKLLIPSLSKLQDTRVGCDSNGI